MTDHKFEPFQQVLMRYGGGGKWVATHFYHIADEIPRKFCTTAQTQYDECIPYTPETAHLLGTTQPYEPPKPPQEYEWGQKVEVFKRGEWDKGLYIGCVPISQLHRVYTDKHGDGLFSYAEIRPLPDTAAHLDAKP